MPQAGSVALVTGGSRGIGAAIAQRLAQAGAADAAEALVARIRAEGGRAIAVQADVADAAAVAAMVARTEAELGPIAILVNNAGISGRGLTLDTYDPAVVARLRAVNVDGVIHTVRAVAPGMRARRYGRI